MYQPTNSLRFREMCEDMPPIKALSFLQTDVFAVVDHSDPVETDVFRSLLTHLLSPAPSSSSSPSPPQESSEHADSPPRKRSRSNTPDGRWTDQLDDDDESTTNSTRTVDPNALKDIEDPIENHARGGDAGKLTSKRFSQRDEIFESLLEFVSEGDKQPQGSLLDMVDGDEGGL